MQGNTLSAIFLFCGYSPISPKISKKTTHGPGIASGSSVEYFRMNCNWPSQFERSDLSKHYLICSFPDFTCVSTSVTIAVSHLTSFHLFGKDCRKKPSNPQPLQHHLSITFPALFNRRPTHFPHLPLFMKYDYILFLVVLSAPRRFHLAFVIWALHSLFSFLLVFNNLT